MEKLRRAVKQVAYTPECQWLSTLSPLQLSLIPLLSLASSLYSAAVRLRRHLYRSNVLRAHRLPVPVISVGNLTWGGNGKTPMVELLARSFTEDGVSPLILTRGYGGGDEAKMLQRQLQGTSARIGVGANRVATAARFFEQYGFKSSLATSGELFSEGGCEIQSRNDQIGVAILDDGMQHLSLRRDLEIVMVNALMPWGNGCLLPLGPLREPFAAFCNADILVIHHADLINERGSNVTVSELPVCVADISIKVPKMAVEKATVLCLSGIGHANSFIQTIERMGPAFVDNLDFSDHHLFELQDLEMVRARLEALESMFDAKPVVVVTEKDYDRAPEVLGHLERYEVLVLCSRLQFIGSTEGRFRKTVKECI